MLTDAVARAMLRLSASDTRERAIRDGTATLSLRMSAALAAREATTSAEPVVIKSVHTALSLEWIAARWEPNVLVVVRNPLNVLASYRDLGMADQDRHLDDRTEVLDRLIRRLGVPHMPPQASPLTRASWQLGVLTTALLSSAEHHGWPIVAHDVACVRPREVFPKVAEELGLTWGPSGDAYVERSNAPGSGFSHRRVAAEQAERWRRSLSDDDVAEIRRVLDGFPTIGPLTAGLS
jgi:hypothetical protein